MLLEGTVGYARATERPSLRPYGRILAAKKGHDIDKNVTTKTIHQ